MAITTITMRVIMQTDKKRPFIHMDITKMGTPEEIHTDITKRLTPENTNSIIHTTITPTAITRKVKCTDIMAIKTITMRVTMPVSVTNETTIPQCLHSNLAMTATETKHPTQI